MTEYPLTLEEIVAWYRSKQRLLAGSVISIVGILESTEYLPSASGDFNGPNTMGGISGWVSGEFDFEVIRVSDGVDMFWRHVNASEVDECESAYADFIEVC